MRGCEGRQNGNNGQKSDEDCAERADRLLDSQTSYAAQYGGFDLEKGREKGFTFKYNFWFSYGTWVLIFT